MSYDIDIGPEDFNYTWNLSPLFHAHIRDGELTGFNAINGKTGAGALKVLARAVEGIDREYGEGLLPHGMTCLDADREVQRKYDPPNGWGSYISAMHLLMRLMAACNRHRRSRVRVS